VESIFLKSMALLYEVPSAGFSACSAISAVNNGFVHYLGSVLVLACRGAPRAPHAVRTPLAGRLPEQHRSSRSGEYEVQDLMVREDSARPVGRGVESQPWGCR